MATIKLQPSGNVLIKDGKVSCGCCALCGPGFYNDMFGGFVYADKENSYEISKDQFDLVQAGGQFNGSASISVDFSPQLNCSFSANSNTIIVGQNGACSTLGRTTIFRGDDISSSPTCINDPLYYGPPPFPSEEVYSTMEFVFFFLKQEDKYYFHISGYIQCPVGNGTALCFEQFKHVGKVYSTGTINFFSIFGADIYYDDDTAFSLSSWSISFT